MEDPYDALREVISAEEVEESSGESSDDDAISREHVRVVVRCRPLDHTKELDGRDQLVISENGHAIDIKNLPGGDRKYSFVCVADGDKDQAFLFKKTGKPIVDCALEGFNGAIVAYGQTGSGKTYTMQGPGLIGKASQSAEARGIIQSVCETIFLHIQECESSNSAVTFSVTASYLEIYNENLVDLLAKANNKKAKRFPKLTIREDSNGGIIVVGQTSVVVKTPEDCYKLLRDGAIQRSAGATKMNSESSRSHAVFTLNIAKADAEKKTKRTSRLHLVDLAGSERQKGTGATGVRLKEASGINKSLSALGNVINALSLRESAGKRGARSIRIPSCRDSKLTFLLKDSLGGNSKLCIIATISPAKASIDETVSTLEFAKRCAAVRNEAVVNEQLTEDIGELQKEVLRLQEANKQLRTDLAKAKAAEVELRAQTTPAIRTSAGRTPVHIQPVEKPFKVKKDVGVQTQKSCEHQDEGKDVLRTVKAEDITRALDSLLQGRLEDEDAESRTEQLCILLADAISREKCHMEWEENMKRKMEDSHQRWMEMLQTSEDLHQSLQEKEAELLEIQERSLSEMDDKAGQHMRREINILQVRTASNPETTLLRHRARALESDLENLRRFGNLSEEGRKKCEQRIKEWQQRWLEMLTTNCELMKALNERDKRLREVRQRGLDNVYDGSGEQLRRDMEEMQRQLEKHPEVVLLQHRVQALEMELVEFAELSMEAHEEARVAAVTASKQGKECNELDVDGIEFATEMEEEDAERLCEDGMLSRSELRQAEDCHGQQGIGAQKRERHGWSDIGSEDAGGKEQEQEGSPRAVALFREINALLMQPEIQELEREGVGGVDEFEMKEKTDARMTEMLRESVEALSVAWGELGA